MSEDDAMTTDLLTAQLMAFASLSDDDRFALARLTAQATDVDARQDLVCAGESTEAAFIMLEGIACRFAQSSTGSRRILALLLPGELCDLDLMHQTRWDHGIAMLTPGRVARVTGVALEDLTLTFPTVSLALRRAKLEAEKRGRVWLAEGGLTSSQERIARLLCEVADRLRMGGSRGETAGLVPLSRADIAACVGLTLVHVSRTLQEFLQAGILEHEGDALRIRDRAKLELVMSARFSFPLSSYAATRCRGGSNLG